jgi:competence protein ComEC
LVLIILSLAWVCGVWLGSQVAPSPLWFLAAILPLGLVAVRRWRAKAVLATLMISLLVGGALFFNSNAIEFDKDLLGKTYTIEGTVSRMPEDKEKSQALRLADVAIVADGSRSDLAGAVLVYVPPFPEYRYGDRITVTGKLLEPPVFDTFDWRAYLACDEVFATVLYPSVNAVHPRHGNHVLAGVYDLRQNLADGIATALPEPHASLAQGLALGIRSGIADDVEADFAASGTSHLLAISGQNLAIIAAVLLFSIRGILGRRGYWYVWLAMAAVWGFTVLSGLAPPVVRAAIMASIFLLAELFGRQKSAAPALFFAAALMVAANPQVLWSASFQMSFAAMAGLIFLLPPLDDLVRRLVTRFPGKDSRYYAVTRYAAEGLAVTTAAVAGVLPLTAYYFGNVSLVGGLATLAAVPAVPLIIFGGLLTGAAAIIHPAAAIPFAAVSWLGLSYLLVVVEIFAQVAPLGVGSFDAAIIWALYGLLAAAAWWLWRWQRRQMDVPNQRPIKFGKLTTIGLPSIVFVAVLASSAFAVPNDHRLQVSFLDVGQGDAIYIRTPSGQDILIDGGPSPQRLTQELSKKMPFWDRTLELVVSTHADADHLTGLVEALRRYKVNQVVTPGVGSDTDLYREWQTILRDKSVPNESIEAGQRIRFEGGLEFEVLNPFDGSATDTNASCIVLNLDYGDLSFLFTGDLTAETELELIYRRMLPDATVLKVAHHGSGGSTSGAFLAVTRPELAVIQVGKNTYGHPKEEVVSALESQCIDSGVFRSDLSGTVTFLTDGRTLWLKSDSIAPLR